MKARESSKVQAHLRDIAGSVLDRHSKTSITIKQVT